MTTLLEKILANENLNQKEATEMMSSLLTSFDAEQTVALLTALALKGETKEEILGCILAARQRMVCVSLPSHSIDTCGTGGDASGTFNISTASAFVVSGAGVPVAKHGNRASSSHCGSADVLESLGLVFPKTPEEVTKMIDHAGFAFLFAPYFHPTFAKVAPIRKMLGFRTIFNVLGPFLNPAGVKKQVVGVSSPILAKTLAHVVATLPYERVLILTSEDGLDEISLGGVTHIYDVSQGTMSVYTLDPEQYGFSRKGKDSLKSTNISENTDIMRRVLQGEKSAYRDVVLLNSAATLYVSGKGSTIEEMIPLAAESIDSGKAFSALQRAIDISKTFSL